MRRATTAPLIGFLLLAAAGCGDSGPKLVPFQGKLLKGGQVFEAGSDEFMQVTFVPILPNGQPPGDHYYANVDDATGVFTAAGKSGKGMPYGKYRVALHLMKKRKDVYKGKYNEENSPFIFDIDAKSKEIVIDVEKPPAG